MKCQEKGCPFCGPTYPVTFDDGTRYFCALHVRRFLKTFTEEEWEAFHPPEDPDIDGHHWMVSRSHVKQEERERIRELYKRYGTFTRVAEETDRHRRTVQRWCSDLVEQYGTRGRQQELDTQNAEGVCS